MHFDWKHSNNKEIFFAWKEEKELRDLNRNDFSKAKILSNNREKN